MLAELSYLYDEPQATGDLRTQESDFKVFENIPFELLGEGEHVFIKIRKTGLNTGFVAKQLSQYFSVKDNQVTYAGLKDRFAVTEQWFSVHLPGKQEYDLADLSIEDVEVLAVKRHHKKLRIGALSGNTFEIILRNVSNISEIEQKWHVINQFGVPNYFGEQRFGIDGGNIARAKALFEGQKVKDKKKRGIYLSAARSLLFNQVIDKRIKQQLFEHLQVGDVLMLSGTQSVFPLEKIDNDIEQRFQEHDVDITAPLWGKGELMTSLNPKKLELDVSEQNQAFCEGLEKFGLKQERRRIRLNITNGTLISNHDDNTVKLTFTLAAGCFATTVLRELLKYHDLTQRMGTIKDA